MRPDEIAIYPTGCELLDEITEFAAERLPALHKPNMSRRASIAEEWWLESMRNRPCPLKQGWAFVYRFARDKAVEAGRCSDSAADLLAHQLSVLMPTMFSAARQIGGLA